MNVCYKYAVAIRVLEVVATLKRAGAEHMVVTLVCGLDRSRFEAGVASLYDAFPNGFEPVLGACAIPVWHLGKRRGFDARIYRRLKELVDEFRPDIVHTHSYVMRYTLPLHVAGMVHTVHNLALREVDLIGRVVHRIGFRRGVVPVAVANEIARDFRRVYRREPLVIHNGIDTAAFRKTGSRDAWRRANGFTDEDVLIVSVARLDPQKNPLRLVEAVAGLDRVQLLLVGDGALCEALRARAGGNVHLLGLRSDVADILTSADVFALASDWEGHPVSVIEAMAAGLPVVATAVGGVPELVEDRISGLLVEPGNVAGLRKALAELAADRDLRAQMGANGAVRAENFSSARMIEQYSRLFESVASQ